MHTSHGAGAPPGVATSGSASHLVTAPTTAIPGASSGSLLGSVNSTSHRKLSDGQAHGVPAVTTDDGAGTSDAQDAPKHRMGLIAGVFGGFAPPPPKRLNTVSREALNMYKYTIPAELVAREIVHRASNGAAIPTKHLRLARLMAVVICGLPLIDFVYFDELRTGDQMVPAIIVAVVAWLGTYPLAFVVVRFLFRIYARSKKKFLQYTAFLAMLDFVEATTANLPFLDLRLPANMPALIGILDVLINVEVRGCEK